MCVNLKGAIGNNIPNDNCVQLQVRNIKAQLNTQGVNKSFDSANKVCMTSQIVEDIRENMIYKTKSVKSRRSRPKVDTTKDISVIVKCF